MDKAIILLSSFDDEEINECLISNDIYFTTLNPAEHLDLIKNFDIKYFPALIVDSSCYQGRDNILEYIKNR